MKRLQLYHSNAKWYQRFLLSYTLHLTIGISVLILACGLPIWGWQFWKKIDANGFNTITGNIIAFSAITFTLREFLRYPGTVSVGYVLPATASVFAILVAFFLMNRVSYSNQLLVTGFLVSLLFGYIEYFLGNRYRVTRYGLVPFGEGKKIPKTHGAVFIRLQRPVFPTEGCDAVIADLGSRRLTPAWEKFLARCTLNGIPVFHTKQIKEVFTGRVKIDHLSENEFGSLLPSQSYGIVKRLIDITASLFLCILLFPFLVAVACFIKAESHGPVFFLQKRMGYRGKEFTMVKFRSMYTDIKGKGFTQEGNDPRITRIGRFIRKFRIDELPQVFNILLGQMSFIGPRPESMELSRWYEKEVPFFAYRHIVRPGISGWAQVEQGYAAEIAGMRAKLEFDFYYIKHFSFWLDTLITFRTIKTIFTGFGAR